MSRARGCGKANTQNFLFFEKRSVCVKVSRIFLFSLKKQYVLECSPFRIPSYRVSHTKVDDIISGRNLIFWPDLDPFAGSFGCVIWYFNRNS